jgi:hypothetical protein
MNPQQGQCPDEKGYTAHLRARSHVSNQMTPNHVGVTIRTPMNGASKRIVRGNHGSCRTKWPQKRENAGGNLLFDTISKGAFHHGPHQIKELDQRTTNIKAEQQKKILQQTKIPSLLLVVVKSDS